MALTTSIYLVVFYTALETVVGKYLYFHDQKTWDEAQTFCRRHHTDLALINSQIDQDQLTLAAGGNPLDGWIGLYLVSKATGEWNWSGAGLATYTNWEPHQPNYYRNEQTRVKIRADGTWNDIIESTGQPFYCSQLVMKTKLSWENALKYCKTNNESLTALTWDNERLLVTGQMQREGVNLVWTGLRFLEDQWLWVSGAPVDPQTQLDVSQCPVKDRCGALNVQGLLQSWDCQDEFYFICE